MKRPSKALILDAVPIVLLIGTFLLVGSALKYEAENYTWGCGRTETLVSYRPISNLRGNVVSYSYTTANNTIYNSTQQFPLNTPVCVENGDIPIKK